MCSVFHDVGQKFACFTAMATILGLWKVDEIFL